MFVKELPEVFSRVRLYKIYSKHTKRWEGNILINVHQIPKISLNRNIITFHLPTHTQTIEYENPLDAEQELMNIHYVLNRD